LQALTIKTKETKIYCVNINENVKVAWIQKPGFVRYTAAVIPAYRQIVFKTIIIAVCAGGSPGRISNVFRKLALLLSVEATIKKLYNFLNSGEFAGESIF
jgi:hypothetical protein